MRRRFLLAWVLLGLMACACSQETNHANYATVYPGPNTSFSGASTPDAGSPAREPTGVSIDASRITTSIRIAEFRGDPQAMGRELGSRYSSEIRNLFNTFLVKPLPTSELIEARLASVNFQQFMLPEHRDELNAMGISAGLNHYDALLGQCFLDLQSVTSCSTISLPASASPDGIARFGRNLDFPSHGIADKHSILFIYHPAGRYAFASVGWPGMIGVLSGMNEYGLTLANMEVPRPARLAVAMPYPLLYRMILEQCRTVDEAIDLLRKTPRQSANNLMLMDADGNRAVAEIRPEGVVVRHAEAGEALLSTNHQRGQDQSSPGRCWRYDALQSASVAQFGQIDVSAIEKMLSQVVQGPRGEMTLQSMVFEPGNRCIYLATGLNAPQRGFERIDLNPYFEKHLK